MQEGLRSRYLVLRYLRSITFPFDEASLSVSHLIQWVSVLTRVGLVLRFFTLCRFVFSAKPLTDDEILDVLFNGDSEIKDCDDSDADSTFSLGDEVDSDDQTDDDASREASEDARRPLFWKTSSRLDTRLFLQ